MVIIAVAILAPTLSYLIMAPEYKEIYTYVRVSNYTGFDVNKTAITFGTVMYWGTSNRELVIENTGSFDKAVSFTFEGNVSSFVRILEPEKIAKANSNTSYTAIAQVPAGTPLGYYDGKVKLFLRRAI